jgi:WD40 repeat protein
VRKRTRLQWVLFFAAALLMVALRVYDHQRPLYDDAARTITLENAADLNELGRLRLDGTARFDPSGRWILSTDNNRVVGIDTDARQRGFEVVNTDQCDGIFILSCNNFAYQFYMNNSNISRLSPNGDYFVAYWAGGDHQGLNVWNFRTGERITTQNAQAGTRVLAFTPDSRFLVFDILQTGLWAYEFATNNYTRLDRDDPLRLLASSQGVYYQTATHIRRVTGAAVENVAAVGVVPGPEPFISPDGRFLLGQDFNTMELTLLELGSEERATFDTHSSGLYELRFSPDGRYAATADYSGIVAVWDLENRRLVHRFVESGVGGQSIAFTPAGDVLFVSNYYRLYAYAVDSGRTLYDNRLADRFFDIDISPHGRYLLTAGGRLYGVE